jgi:hypothetical protein
MANYTISFEIFKENCVHHDDQRSPPFGRCFNPEKYDDCIESRCPVLKGNENVELSNKLQDVPEVLFFQKRK